MKKILYPHKKDWQAIVQRPAKDPTILFEQVKTILQDIRMNGDLAVRKYSLEFDKADLDQFKVTGEEMRQAISLVAAPLKKAIEAAADNIRRFHEKELPGPRTIETMPGIKCWKKQVAVEKVGLYIPGGTAPLFSTVLMLGIPARIAGCREIVLTTPPGKDNKVHPAILFAAQLVGVTSIFKVGGVQAIGALAYGTETIPAVHKIFGPGNQYVNCAKQWVQLNTVAIDMPAGPSEVCVMADQSCDPSFVAADLLSQAEHGTDSQVLLVCTDEKIVDEVLKEIDKQAGTLTRKEMIAETLENSSAVVMTTADEMIELVNAYAPEHLVIGMRNAEAIADKIINAGSVFIGNYTPEAAGDYASGTNHVLPTNGFAKSYSGVGVDSFMKTITYQQITKEGLQGIGDTVEQMSLAEGLDAHWNAVKLRLKK